MEGESHETETWLAVVTNNRPDNAFALMPQRNSLDRGILTVHWAHVATRMGIFWLVLSYVLNIMNLNPQVEIRESRSIEIHDSDRELKVDLDGETLTLSPPLEYRIKPRSLTVLINEEDSPLGS
jgi:diacylglycerol kinase family enzyme